MPARRFSPGFTLVELLVVLAMIALLVTLARPMYSAAVPGAKLRAEVLELATNLRQSRHRAITSGQVIVVRFDTEASSYTIADAITQLSASTRLKSLLPAAGRGDEKVVQLEFHPDGSSTGASVTLAGSTAAFRLDVDWLTGRIRVAEQDLENS